MLAADDAVIGALEAELLTPAFIDSIVAKVLTRTTSTGTDVEQQRADLRTHLAAVTSELNRLVEGLACTGVSSALTTAIRARERQQAALQTALATLDRRGTLATVESQRIATAAREKAQECKALLRRHTPVARQILAKTLREKFVFRPETKGKERGVRFTGESCVIPLLQGIVPELSQAVASPAGFEPALPA